MTGIEVYTTKEVGEGQQIDQLDGGEPADPGEAQDELLSIDNFRSINNPWSGYWENGGDMFYILTQDGNTVHQYEATTPYDFTTLTNNFQFSPAEPSNNMNDIEWNNDGTRFLWSWDDTTSGIPNSWVEEYLVSTAYDLNTATHNIQFQNDQTSKAYNITWADGGSIFYLMGLSTDVFDDTVIYNAGTPYDISTLTHQENLSLDISSNGRTSAKAMIFYQSGDRSLISYRDTIAEFSLATPYDITTRSHIQNIPTESGTFLDADQFSLDIRERGDLDERVWTANAIDNAIAYANLDRG